MSQLNSAATVSFEVFTKEFSLYPRAAFATFHIVRDIMIKQEVHGVTLQDGTECGIDGYLIRCVSKITQCNRVIVPCAADQEIDLLRLRDFLITCRAQCTEAYICVCTPESIIYELVEVDLV